MERRGHFFEKFRFAAGLSQTPEETPKETSERAAAELVRILRECRQTLSYVASSAVACLDDKLHQIQAAHPSYMSARLSGAIAS